MMIQITRFLIFLLSLLLAVVVKAEPDTRLTVLYDAFGMPSELTKDWGFSLLVEYRGQQVLFDTGNNGEIFSHNVHAKGVELDKLAFAIISHRHGDHMGGLSYLISQRTELEIYAPREGFGVFGSTLPGNFYPDNAKLPAEMRYFNGQPPEQLTFGKAWPDGRFQLISTNTEIAPGMHLLALRGEWGTDLPLQELSLVLETPKGLIVIVGCSHPTIENIVATAKQSLGQPVYLVIGGTHLLPAPAREIQRIADALKTSLSVDWIAPAHCTGEPAFQILREQYKEHYLYAGLGSSITINDEGEVTASESVPSISMQSDDALEYRLLSQIELSENHP